MNTFSGRVTFPDGTSENVEPSVRIAYATAVKRRDVWTTAGGFTAEELPDAEREAARLAALPRYQDAIVLAVEELP